jgi:indolepyruvate ferredoxin oxidoreductase beta subunit
MFGALAGTGVLPFSRSQFEGTIERGGVGVKPSLKAFAAAYGRAGAEPAALADTGQTRTAALPGAPVPSGPVSGVPRDPQVRALLDRIADNFPVSARPVLTEGVRRLIDYQDPAYAGLYLDRLARIAGAPAEGEPLLLQESARHLALWMSYEDTIRVAELKTRATRFERVRDEVHVSGDQVLAISEFMHPRLEEICDTLPAGLGRWLQGSGRPRRLVERFTCKGRVIPTSSLRGFLALFLVAGMKRWRRSTLRFVVETQRIERWLAQIEQTAAVNPRLAVEVAQCQSLVKGYSDTHTRGLRNFEALMAVVQRAGAALAPATLRELRDAALADEHGAKLRAALARHAPA